MLLTHAKGGPNLAQVVARGVRWVHAYGTGVDEFPIDALGDRVLTCSRGASAIPIAEWVLAVMLAFEKKLPDSWIHEPPAHWSVAALGGLRGRTLGAASGSAASASRWRCAPSRSGCACARCAGARAPSPLAGVEVVRELEALLAERGPPRARGAEHARDAPPDRTPPRSRA